MSDIEKKLNRQQIIRIDCPTCRGNGFFMKDGAETFCELCDGTGSKEKAIPFKFETNGRLTQEEIKQEFDDNPIDTRPNIAI